MEINAWVWPHPLRITFCFQSMLLKYGKIYILHILICPITCVACKKIHCSLLYSKPKFPDSSFPKVCLWIGVYLCSLFLPDDPQSWSSSFFFLGYLKLKGGRHSKCCEEQCTVEEKGRWGEKNAACITGGGKIGCERRWDSSAGISTMRRGLCRVFQKDVFKALKCN